MNNTIKRTPGSAKGIIRVSDDFEAPLPEKIIEEFETDNYIPRYTSFSIG